MTSQFVLRNGKMGKARTRLSNRIIRLLELMNMVPNIRFNSLVSHDFEKITSLVMTHYAMNYVISEKSKNRQRCYILEKKQNTQSWFSGWYSKKMISHDVMKQHDVILTLYDVIIGSLFTDYMAITSKFINSIFDQSESTIRSTIKVSKSHH